MSSSLPTGPVRIGWVERLRVISCIGVVLIHVSGATYARFTSAPAWEWWLANLMDGSCRASVPLFVMISGALMKETDCDPRRFYQKKALRLLPVILAWSALYVVFDRVVLGMKPQQIGMLFISKGFVYLHLWYLSMWGFLLAFAPYLARLKFPSASRSGDNHILLTICIGAISLDWAAEYLCRVNAVPFFHWTLTFAIFIPYFLLGMFLSEPTSSPSPGKAGGFLFGALAASWAANFVTATFFGITDDTMPLSNQSPFVMAVAVAVFLFIRQTGSRARNPAWIGSLSDASFGIYLLHPLFIWLAGRLLRATAIDPVSGAWMPLTAITVYLVSFACVFVLRRTSVGRKLS